jgi:hypothetical protein
VLIIVDITSPHIAHSTKPSPAALILCPLTIIQVFSDWMLISIIFAAQTIRQTRMGCIDDKYAKNSDIFTFLKNTFFLYFITKAAPMQPE